MIALKNKIKIFSYSILFITVYSVIFYPSKIDILKYLDNTALLWSVMLVIFWAYFQLSKNKLNSYQLRFVKYYLLWNIVMFVAGIFVADGYWEFKVLVMNSFGCFLSLSTYTLIEPYYTKKILSVYYRNIIWLGIPLLFLVNPNSYGFFLFPFSFLLLLFPLLDVKWRIITILVSILSFASDLEARSTILKFGIAGILALTYYIGFYFSKNVLNLIHKIFMVLPFMLLITASAGIFNPFNMDAYIKGDYNSDTIDENGQRTESNLKTDTRTALYVEVIQTAQYYNSWITGRTPAKGNRTELFSDLKAITGKAERSGNEVAILNIFTWTGIIGIILYFLIFFRASWLAINKSKSYFMKVLGLYLSFRWMYSWVEDINNYSLNYFMIWIMIAMAYSDKFRLMSERELLLWTRSIFNRKYRVFDSTPN